MIRRRSAAIALCWLSCSAAIAKDYSDEECQKGSKGMTLRLVRIVEDHDKTGRLERNGIFEIKNDNNKVFYCGYTVRGGYHVDFPDATLQMEDLDGVWQDALFLYLGVDTDCSKKLEVRYDMTSRLVIGIPLSPDYLHQYNFKNLNLKVPHSVRIFLRDFDRKACVASDPFTLPQ